MSTPYQSQGYIPPIPVLSVRFRQLASSEKTDAFDAIIDTGADMTVAPAQILIDLHAQDIRETNLVSQWGDIHRVVLYLVDIEIKNQVFPGIQVAGDETADEVILGRNFLNKLPLFLDGPQQQMYIVDNPNVRRFLK